MRAKIIRIIKILGIVFVLLFVILLVLFYRFSTPKSDDAIRKDFSESGDSVYIETRTFKNFTYRVIKPTDRQGGKPTVVFVHGSIGSAMDFSRYLKDSALQSSANLIAYDRVGYGVHHTGEVQASIAFERELLEDLLKDHESGNTVLVGYSYGGPVVLSSFKAYRKIILLAPAVHSGDEKEPWALNLYRWGGTRWLIPRTWKAASIEKLSHAEDLQRIEDQYHKQISPVMSIHGDEDWVVPFGNSEFLKGVLPENNFKLVPLKGAGHGLVWSRFDTIRNLILEQVKEPTIEQ